ncbi:MAG: PAS domain S-box protein [Polyangiaceae bacterium]
MVATSAEEASVEIRRLEDRLRILSEATRAFADATTDYQRLVAGVAQRLVDVIGDTCNVYILSDDRLRLDAVAMCGPDEANTRMMREMLARAPLLLAEQAGLRHIIESGDAIMIPKFDAEQLRGSSSATLTDYEKKVGIHSVLVMPLRLHKKSIGMLTMTRFRKESPSFDHHDRDLAQMLADHASLAIGNARAYAEARRLRIVAETSDDAARAAKTRFSRLEEAGVLGIIVNDFEGRVIEVNETLSKIVGYSRVEIFSESFDWSAMTPAAWKETDQRALDELHETGAAGLREKQYIRKDGSLVWVMAGSATIDGTSQIISFVLDITERKTAEADAERLRDKHAIAAQFRELVEAAPDALVIVDGGDRIVIVNAETERLFGYTRVELIGQSVSLLLVERDRAVFSARKKRDPNDAPLFARSELELRCQRKDGTEFPAEATLGPVRIEKVPFVSAAIRDVTERKKLEDQRFALAAIVESAADAIIGTSLDGIVTSWNRGAEKLFGYTAAEILGKGIAILVPSGHEEEKARIAIGVRNGEAQYTETVRRTKAGRNVDVSVTWSPVRDATGVLIGTSKWARDITERRRAEVALAKAKDEALLANRELEAFSYSVAHDLRAPLRGMNGFAQVLLDSYGEKLDADGRDWLEEIRLNARRMGELIDALLSLSRVTRSALRREPVDLSATTRAVAARLTHADPSRTVDFVVAPDLHLDADLALTRAVIENLVGNAWKFTAKSDAPKIEVGEVEKNGQHAFFVRDNGAGFDMTFAAKLFTPFQRLHGSSEFPGTGIGLATVQRIVHRHGGRVWAEGEVGGGATFYFTLPNESGGGSS